MDARLNMSEEHVVLSMKGSNTLGYIDVRVAKRLKVLMVFLLLSTNYVAFRILHPAFSSSVQKIFLQTRGSSGEATEKVRAGALVL